MAALWQLNKTIFLASSSFFYPNMPNISALRSKPAYSIHFLSFRLILTFLGWREDRTHASRLQPQQEVINWCARLLITYINMYGYIFPKLATQSIGGHRCICIYRCLPTVGAMAISRDMTPSRGKHLEVLHAETCWCESCLSLEEKLIKMRNTQFPH